MGGRDIDGVGKCGQKAKAVLGSVEKLLIPGKLIHCILVLSNIPETLKTHLLQPGH